METGTRQVKYAIPEDLVKRVEALAKRCGVDPINVVCVGLKMVTDVAIDDEGLRYLQELAPLLLKAGKVN